MLRSHPVASRRMRVVRSGRGVLVPVPDRSEYEWYEGILFRGILLFNVMNLFVPRPHESVLVFLSDELEYQNNHT